MPRQILLGQTDPYIEKKYVLNPTNALRAKAYLDHYFEPEVKHHKGQTWTLYFDTKEFHSRNEVINGEYSKEKFRARIYDPKMASVIFERKRKTGLQVIKSKIILNHSTSLETLPKQLYPRFYSELNALFENKVCHRKLIPKVLLYYQRTRFYCPYQKFRLNLDQNIARLGRFSPDGEYFEDYSPSPFNVLEVKASGSIDLPRAFSSFCVQGTSFSKYSRHIVC